MRRALIACVAFSAATLPLTAALAATTAPAVRAFPQPTEAERRDTVKEFVEDAMRTASERSGDVFFLPRKYNFVTGVGPDKLNTGHVKVNGRITEITSTGISHGIPWDYDRDLPLIYLYHSTWIWGMGKDVTGFVPYPDGLLRLEGVSKS